MCVYSEWRGSVGVCECRFSIRLGRSIEGTEKFRGYTECHLAGAPGAGGRGNQAGGKGFADLVFIPRKQFPDKPALVVELKWDKSAQGAIEQIKRKEYCRSLEDYQGNILLVGINYEVKTKEHTCIIERYRKN